MFVPSPSSAWCCIKHCGGHTLQKVTCVIPIAQGLSVCDDKIWPCCSMQQAAKHEHKAAAHFTSSTVSTGAAVLRLVCPCPCAGDLALLQHDKPLAKGNSAPHLKHIPAYLRDPTAATPSFPGNAGKGTFPFCKCTVYHPPPPPRRSPLPYFRHNGHRILKVLPCLPAEASGCRQRRVHSLRPTLHC